MKGGRRGFEGHIIVDMRVVTTTTCELLIHLPHKSTVEGRGPVQQVQEVSVRFKETLGGGGRKLSPLEHPREEREVEQVNAVVLRFACQRLGVAFAEQTEKRAEVLKVFPKRARLTCLGKERKHARGSAHGLYPGVEEARVPQVFHPVIGATDGLFLGDRIGHEGEGGRKGRDNRSDVFVFKLLETCPNIPPLVEETVAKIV